MADVSVTDMNPCCIFNNIGGLAGNTSRMSVFFTYQNYVSLPGLHKVTAGFHGSIGPIHLGAGLFRFGEEIFNEQMLIVGAGHKIRHTSLGISLQYHQFHMEQYGNIGTVSISFGGITKINDNLLLGAFIFNASQASLSENTGEKIPTVMNLGLSYTMKTGFRFCIESEKEIDYPVSIRSGLEYNYRKKFFIRSGIKIQPFASCYGIGFHSRRFIIDYGLQNNRQLGISQQVSLVFFIKSIRHDL